MVEFEIARLIVQAASALLIFCSLIYAGRQLALSTRTQRQNHDWNRRAAAQEANWKFSSLVKGRELIDQAFNITTRDAPLTIDELNTAFEKNSELKTAVLSLLNYYEGLAIGVNQSIFDEDVIKTAWYGSMKVVSRLFAEWVKELRKTRPFAFSELDAILNEWGAAEARNARRTKTDTL